MVLLAVSGTGCVALISDSYYHGPGHRRKTWQSVGPFDFELDEARIRGVLESSKTIIFTPTPPIGVIIVSHNPYHLRLWLADIENEYTQLARVRVEMADGELLFDTLKNHGIIQGDSEPQNFGSPVFIKNPRWSPYRRFSSRQGWQDSQAFSVPWFAPELVLTLYFRNRTTAENNETWRKRTVRLVRHHRLEFGPLLKDIFRATGTTARFR